MNEVISCPNCHQPIIEMFYFCPNCGRKIRPVPLSTSLGSQLILYLKTLLLPPLGILWGYRYLGQSDNKSKVIGLFVIVLTIVEIVWLTQSTLSIINTISQQINQQLYL